MGKHAEKDILLETKIPLLVPEGFFIVARSSYLKRGDFELEGISIESDMLVIRWEEIDYDVAKAEAEHWDELVNGRPTAKSFRVVIRKGSQQTARRKR